MQYTEQGRAGRRILALVATLGVLALVAVPLASAQARGAVNPTAMAQEGQLGIPETPRNLQVLPADMSTRASSASCAVSRPLSVCGVSIATWATIRVISAPSISLPTLARPSGSPG